MGPFPVEVGAGLDFDLAGARLRMPEPKLGGTAPDFVLLAEDASTVQLSFLRGRPVVLAFLSREERSAALAAALARRAEIGARARMLAIFTDADATTSMAVEEFRATTGFSGPVLLDQILSVTLQYQSQECPRLWLIDAEGRIRFTADARAVPAEQVARDLSAALDRALAQAPH